MPGPWHLDDLAVSQGGFYGVSAGKTMNIPIVVPGLSSEGYGVHGVTMEMAYANAALIAAAPELLEALQGILADVEEIYSQEYSNDPNTLDSYCKAKATVAKALTVNNGK